MNDVLGEFIGGVSLLWVFVLWGRFCAGGVSFIHAMNAVAAWFEISRALRLALCASRLSSILSGIWVIILIVWATVLHDSGTVLSMVAMCVESAMISPTIFSWFLNSLIVVRYVMTDCPLTMWWFSYLVHMMLILLGSVDSNFLMMMSQAIFAWSVSSIAV